MVFRFYYKFIRIKEFFVVVYVCFFFNNNFLRGIYCKYLYKGIVGGSFIKVIKIFFSYRELVKLL